MFTMKTVVALFLTASAFAQGPSPARDRPERPKQIVLPSVPPPLTIPAGQVCVNLSSAEMTSLKWAQLSERGAAVSDAQGTVTIPTAHKSVQEYVEWMVRGYAGEDPKINQGALVQLVLQAFGTEAQQRYREAQAKK